MRRTVIGLAVIGVLGGLAFLGFSEYDRRREEAERGRQQQISELLGKVGEQRGKSLREVNPVQVKINLQRLIPLVKASDVTACDRLIGYRKDFLNGRDDRVREAIRLLESKRRQDQDSLLDTSVKKAEELIRTILGAQTPPTEEQRNILDKASDLKNLAAAYEGIANEIESVVGVACRLRQSVPPEKQSRRNRSESSWLAA